MLYTASGELYASKIVEFIDPSNRYFTAVLHRKHCISAKSVYTKSIGVLSNRNRSNVIAIDNSLFAFPFDYSQMVLVRPFIDDMEDCELLKLLVFVKESLVGEGVGVGETVGAGFGCGELLECLHVNELVGLFKRYLK